MRFAKTLLVLMLILIMTSMVCQAAEPSLVLQKALIISRSENPQAGSGLLVFWVKLVAQLDSGFQHELFIVYLSEDQPLPLIVHYYNIQYHRGYLHGEYQVVYGEIDPVTMRSIQPENIIDDFIEYEEK